MTDDARLRRVQVFAPGEAVGLGVARYLLSAKVAGQAQLIARRFALRTVQVGLGTPPSVHTVLPT